MIEISACKFQEIERCTDVILGSQLRKNIEYGAQKSDATGFLLKNLGKISL